MINESRISGMKRALLFGALALCCSVGVAQADDITVSEARLSILPVGDTPGAGYFQLHNAGSEDIALVGAASAAFETTEIHVSTEHEGMAHMHAIEQIDIASDEVLEFAPKGHHLMFMRRVEPLAEGDDVEVTLYFDNESSLTVNFDVVSPTSL